MTQQEAINKIIDISESYIGYLEKASKDNLDDPKANIGSGNYTKFARDFFPELQGLEWCCMFVYACFAYAFNPIMAQNLLSGCKTAKCSVLYDAMKKSGQNIEDPYKAQKGDIIFFNKNGSINHIGIVTEIKNDVIETVEGNTSVGNNVVINSGGGVYQKYYSIFNSRIYAFGRPKWNLVSNVKDDEIIENKVGNAYINATDVNIRSGPGTKYDKLFTLKKGYQIKVLSEIKDEQGNIWYEIDDNNKKYVRSDLVSFSEKGGNL